MLPNEKLHHLICIYQFMINRRTLFNELFQDDVEFY